MLREQQNLILELYTFKMISLFLFVLQDSDSEKETEQEFEATNIRGQQLVDKSYDRTPDIVLRPRKSRFRDADSPDSHTVTDESPTATPNVLPIVQKRSREELLQNTVSRRDFPHLAFLLTNFSLFSHLSYPCSVKSFPFHALLVTSRSKIALILFSL